MKDRNSTYELDLLDEASLNGGLVMMSSYLSHE